LGGEGRAQEAASPRAKLKYKEKYGAAGDQKPNWERAEGEQKGRRTPR